MKSVGIVLILFGAIGLGFSSVMFGDIGIAAAIGSIVGVISGIGFMKAAKLEALLTKDQI
ncbi:hypothetical protein [Candidatus Albibeggiatoa sp. nov. BB20]|uniref:hypothetical protein n=1 Tax=Candidatus Albibeggiatoa sp. nov. BB20 TaxID=3162723 RepID=UPI0033653E86